MKKKKWIIMGLFFSLFVGGCARKEAVSVRLESNSSVEESKTESSVQESPMEIESSIQESSLEAESSIPESQLEESEVVSLGNWNYTTFTNGWSNIKMTVSKSAAIFTREQFPLFVTMKENQIWDVILMLDDWDSSIYIFYEKPEKEIDIDTFLKQKLEELEAPEGLTNQINGWSDVVLGSETYRKMETSIRNDKFTDFYAREKDGYFLVIQVRSTPFKLEEMKGILDTIDSVNEKE